jgi:hypothetical protein
VGQVEARLAYLEIVLILMRDRCTVCAKHTIGWEIILAHPMALLRDVGQVEAYFSPFEGSVKLDRR